MDNFFSEPPGSLKPLWNATVTDRLKHELLLHYDKFARPAQHYNTTTVTVGLTIKHLDLNEQRSTFTVNSWIQVVSTLHTSMRNMLHFFLIFVNQIQYPYNRVVLVLNIF